MAINYNDGDFSTAVRAATDDRGVNVVLDHVGGRYLGWNIDSLANDGRLVIIGLIGGAKADINLALLLIRRLQIIGSTLRTRSVDEKADIVRQFQARFGTALLAGRIKPVVDCVLPLADAAEAHRIVQASTHFGKVALRLD